MSGGVNGVGSGQPPTRPRHRHDPSVAPTAVSTTIPSTTDDTVDDTTHRRRPRPPTTATTIPTTTRLYRRRPDHTVGSRDETDGDHDPTTIQGDDNDVHILDYRRRPHRRSATTTSIFIRTIAPNKGLNQNWVNRRGGNLLSAINLEVLTPLRRRPPRISFTSRHSAGAAAVSSVAREIGGVGFT